MRAHLTVNDVKKQLAMRVKNGKASALQRFFKTGKGQYGEGDVFIGVMVPQQREVAQMFQDIELKELEKLLESEVHEHRLTALFILVKRYQKLKNAAHKKELFEFYISHRNCINNWDLVDSSARQIVGEYLCDKDKEILYDFAQTGNLWERRIAIIATNYFITHGNFNDTMKIAEILMDDKEDLIHKAVGWMLREIGNVNHDVEEEFLKKHYQKMPRTMLRYAIEKFTPARKAFFMAK